MPVTYLFLAILIIWPTSAMAADAGLWTELVNYIRIQQQAFHRELAGALRDVQTGGTQAAWALISLSFLYGIFHAAGPGHGKVVISTYLVSRESRLKRGIALSFAAAFVQGLSAVILVQGVVGILDFSSRQAQQLTPVLEQVSFALIAFIGLYLIRRAVKSFLARRTHHHSHSHSHTHEHHHDHDHEHHHDHNGVCTSCGHSHAPSPDDLSDDADWKETLGIILSVGIRPCSGSVLVLIFVEVISLRWAGITSVFAVSLGTAITVSFLAITTIYFRKLALTIANRQGSTIMLNLSTGATFAGGLVITLLGMSLFVDASLTSHPLF